MMAPLLFVRLQCIMGMDLLHKTRAPNKNPFVGAQKGCVLKNAPSALVE